MTTLAPERTTDQRAAALQLANRIRTQRSELKRALTGPAHAATIILNPPTFTRTMKVRDLLLAIPLWGPAKVGRFMRCCQISDSKTAGGLSDRQREALAKELRS